VVFATYLPHYDENNIAKDKLFGGFFCHGVANVASFSLTKACLYLFHTFMARPKKPQTKVF